MKSKYMIMVFILVIIVSFTGCKSKPTVEINEPTEDQTAQTQQPTIVVPDIQVSDLYGSWENGQDSYFIKFEQDGKFYMNYYDSSQLGNLPEIYSGTYDIQNGNTLYFHATAHTFINQKFQIVWGNLDSPFDMAFVYDKDNSADGTKAFLGGTSQNLGSNSTFITTLNLKKDMTDTEFNTKVDAQLIQDLHSKYDQYGEYEIQVVSSTWNRKDKRYATIDDCIVKVTDIKNKLEDTFNIIVTYKLSRLTDINRLEALSMLSSDGQAIANIANYNNMTGKMEYKDKVYLPKHKIK